MSETGRWQAPSACTCDERQPGILLHFEDCPTRAAPTPGAAEPVARLSDWVHFDDPHTGERLWRPRTSADGPAAPSSCATVPLDVREVVHLIRTERDWYQKRLDENRPGAPATYSIGARDALDAMADKVEEWLRGAGQFTSANTEGAEDMILILRAGATTTSDFPCPYCGKPIYLAKSGGGKSKHERIGVTHVESRSSDCKAKTLPSSGGAKP